MPRVKAKKAKDDKLRADKRQKIVEFMDNVHSQCDEFEARLQADCALTCDKISKLYADKLNSLPEHIRNMTLTEYLAMQQQQQEVEGASSAILQDLTGTASIRSRYEKTKFDSEKKKTLKKKSERKRSLSASVCSNKKVLPPNLPRMSRVMSESCLSTPKNKQSFAPAFVVTPKFNPKMPVIKSLKRKPRAGEMLLSMSGSPIVNSADDIAGKPSVSVPVCGGNYINITEDTEVGKLESDFLKKLDEDTKSALANLRQKLDVLLEKK